MEKNEVNEAFEILLEEIEIVADSLNEEAHNASVSGNYEKARSAIEEAELLAQFREKVKVLQKEWNDLVKHKLTLRKRRKKRKTRSHLPPGKRTPEDAFRRPILEAIVELGGSARVRDVLDKVEQKMEGILNKFDYMSLPSGHERVRWRNTAKWCRYTLVKEGLLKKDSPHGIWEISEKGKKWLQIQDKSPGFIE